MRLVALIPARAGSKRLPGKNLLPLGGRPLIAHTCAAALRSGVCTAVYVNTDSPQIAAAAEAAGVACPVLRPAHLADDRAATRAANLFLLDYLAQRGEHYDAVLVLQPTSPLRTADDICAAWSLFQRHSPCAVFSVSPVAPANWLGRVSEAGEFVRLDGAQPIARLNGAIYLYNYADYVQQHEPRRSLAYVMPVARGVDIDTREDLDNAEFLLGRAHPIAAARQ